MIARSTGQERISLWVKYVRDTRTWGGTYVHAMERGCSPKDGMLDGNPVTFDVASYGRSLLGGGHKYKVHARAGGEPVPSRDLGRIVC